MRIVSYEMREDGLWGNPKEGDPVRLGIPELWTNVGTEEEVRRRTLRLEETAGTSEDEHYYLGQHIREGETSIISYIRFRRA